MGWSMCQSRPRRELPADEQSDLAWLSAPIPSKLGSRKRRPVAAPDHTDGDEEGSWQQRKAAAAALGSSSRSNPKAGPHAGWVAPGSCSDVCGSAAYPHTGAADGRAGVTGQVVEASPALPRSPLSTHRSVAVVGARRREGQRPQPQPQQLVPLAGGRERCQVVCSWPGQLRQAAIGLGTVGEAMDPIADREPGVALPIHDLSTDVTLSAAAPYHLPKPTSIAPAMIPAGQQNRPVAKAQGACASSKRFVAQAWARAAPPDPTHDPCAFPGWSKVADSFAEAGNLGCDTAGRPEAILGARAATEEEEQEERAAAAVVPIPLELLIHSSTQEVPTDCEGRALGAAGYTQLGLKLALRLFDQFDCDGDSHLSKVELRCVPPVQ
jgi:hypothetical protein